MKSDTITRIVLVGLLAVFVIFMLLAGFLGDLYWFMEIGYEDVFLSIITTRIILGIAGFVVFFGFSYGCAIIAARTASGSLGRPAGGRQGIAALALFASLIAGLNLSAAWETVLRFFAQVPFGVSDPVFSQDIGFYVFSLPFYSLVLSFLLGLFIFAAILSALAFLFQVLVVRVRGGQFPTFDIEAEREPVWGVFFSDFLPQLNILLFLVFVVLAARLWLFRYSILYSSTGAVFGAGYTDIHITLPVITILSVVALIIGIGFLLNEKIQRREVIIYSIAAFAGIAIIGIVVALLVQSLVVEPDEFTLEKQYLDYNIQNTLDAYDLSRAEEQIFPVNYTLTAEDIRENRATVENIRLWDWRPLKSTYEQLQLFRTYYQFYDVDVDRYMVDGMYKQVLISPREMDIRSLPAQAQTWVNQHLVYTHGYGVVMNPVDVVTTEGLPDFYIKDIPPTSPYFTIDEPRIYYGEGAASYAVTRTSTDEFDYPAGDQNIYTGYDGTGGVALDGIVKKLIYAIKFNSIELLVSGSMTPDSRLLFNRNVAERTAQIAPFLSYDTDPYIVVADGRLYWIIDAYTTTDAYPYSEPVMAGNIGSGERLNYIRNSVKVVVDAYNGDVSYYIIDPEDPMVSTYDRMFPGVFQGIEEMPDSLSSHLRYPEDIFRIQAQLYTIYHMKDPRVFYNREDAWVIPDELYRQQRQQMVPYYIIMKLPGEEGEEFIMMLPFTPRNKENLIGWMAARSDQPVYGDLLVYQFSKQELTYGPMQVEARIDQDTAISQDITLWSQSGSSVLRGNTLIIPIENSLLYVEPLYLEATERGTLPQLKRVIVAYNDRLTMQETLSDALSVIFEERTGTTEGGEEPQPPISETDLERLARIADLYDRAQQALARGDLGQYQRYFDEIGDLVKG